ncbi:MAG: hypothetical protein AB7F59_07260 [Bdellovibrionales bacterium]
MNRILTHQFSKLAWTVTFSLTSLYSHAAIPPQQTSLNLEAVTPVAPQTTITSHDISGVIPLNLQPGQKEQDVGIKVVDHTLNTFTQGDFFKNSELGKAASGVEQAMKTEVHFGNPQENEIQHSLNMQVQAFEQKAFLKYSGLANVQVTYLMSGSDLNLEFNENLGGSTQLVVSHEVQDQLSKAQLRWNW